MRAFQNGELRAARALRDFARADRAVFDPGQNHFGARASRDRFG